MIWDTCVTGMPDWAGKMDIDIDIEIEIEIEIENEAEAEGIRL